MTDKGADVTTLEDLKRAVNAVPSRPPKHSPCEDYLNHADLLTEAWRTYAQFLMRFCSTYGSEYPEFMEAVKLVQERLK